MIRNFVLQTANAPGTGIDVRLGDAKQGRLKWRDVYSDGSPAFYFIDDGNQGEWGIGTVHVGSPDTLSRTTVVGNTALTTARLNFTGACDVYNEIIAERSVYVDDTGTLRTNGARIDTQAGGTPVGGGMDYWGSTPPAGWIWAAGQEISRTTYAKLFAVIGTMYGAGNGSTTFKVPDKRGRTSFGLDSMGGTAAGRLSVIQSVLGATGGSENLQAHTHGLNWSDPGHAHSLLDPGHAHGVSDPGHAHGTFDPGHSHYYNQPTLEANVFVRVAPLGSGGAGIGFAATLASGSNTGVQVSPGVSNIGIFPGATNMSVYGSGTGISASVASSGSGGAQNVPPGIGCNYILFCAV